MKQSNASRSNEAPARVAETAAAPTLPSWVHAAGACAAWQIDWHVPALGSEDDTVGSGDESPESDRDLSLVESLAENLAESIDRRIDALRQRDPRYRDAPLAWLLDAGSLTLRLKRLCQERFQVALAEEGWSPAGAGAHTMSPEPAASSTSFWSRKVVLMGDGQPWVYAHTLVPERALEGELREVLALGQRPLGEWLFEHPTLRRSAIEIAQVSEQLWGRRSWFFVDERPILVAEFFLEALASRPVPRA